jgi:hypothetical protein
MRVMRGTTKALGVAVLALCMLGIVVATGPDAEPGAQGSGLELLSRVNPGGQGESLVLVVAGSYGSEAEAAGAEAAGAIGDLAGFNIRRGASFATIGVYVQSSEQTEAILCGDRRSVELGIDCHASTLDVGTPLKFRPPVELRLIPMDPDVVANGIAVPACGMDHAPPACLPSTVADLPGFQLTDGGWHRVTAFRTLRGAEEFLALLRDGFNYDLSEVGVLQVTKLDGKDVGLGQESHPDGTGPLVAPLEDQRSHQD